VKPSTGPEVWTVIADPEVTVFLQGMADRMAISFFKYGPFVKGPLDKWVSFEAMSSADLRLKAYESSGNTEYLMDVANFFMMEFMRPHCRTPKHTAVAAAASEKDEKFPLRVTVPEDCSELFMELLACRQVPDELHVRAAICRTWDAWLLHRDKRYLIDAAAIAMREFIAPHHEHPYFRPTDSRESPGIVYMGKRHSVGEDSPA